MRRPTASTSGDAASPGSRGDVSAETAVISAVLFGLVFLIVGLGSWWTSSQTAALAAGRAATAASRGNLVAGMNAAEQTVRDLGGTMASAPSVRVVSRTVVVEVSVVVGSPAGVMPSSVTRRTVVALEEFAAEGDR